jgi:hypothetical protein
LDGEPSWNAGALQAPTIDTDPTLQSNAIVSSKFSFKFSFTYPKSHCDADKLWAYIPKSAGLRNVVDEIFLALARNAAPCPSSANVSAWCDGAAAARRGFSAYVPGVETLKLPTLHGLNSSRKRRAKTNGFPTKRIADVIQSGPSAETGSSARAKVGVWCVYAPGWETTGIATYSFMPFSGYRARSARLCDVKPCVPFGGRVLLRKIGARSSRMDGFRPGSEIVPLAFVTQPD